MKKITGKDLQGLYHSPSAEDTEALLKTLSALPDQEEAAGSSGFWRRRVAFVLAASLILITGITALAVTISGRTGSVWFTWGGEEADPPKATAVPEKDDGWSMEKVRQVQEILDAVPDEYYTTADWLNGLAGSGRKKKRKVDSPERLIELLDAAGYPHPVPLIPEGYSFNDAEVLIGCAPEGEYRLVSRTVVDDFSLEQYAIAPEDEIIIGYSIHVWSKPGEPRALLPVSSQLSTAKERTFGFDDASGVTAEPISVPGMEEALCFRYLDDHETLDMVRRLENPVPFRTNPIAFAADLPKEPEPTGEYLYEQYSISGIPPEDVLPLFTGSQQE